jgi:hypothetical protein
MKKQIPILDRPRNVNLNQFILNLNMSECEIEKKYAVRFEDAEDDISPVRLALLTDGSASYFLIMARPDIEDFPISVFAQDQDDLTCVIEKFISILNVEKCDICSRVDEGV